MAMMLDHLGAGEPARAIEAAVKACVAEKRCTHDIGGDLTTSRAGDAVVERIG
ncbi:MAG: isocitrate/isopropylmalate family dehydrogenase [Thermoanaerobaculia bacterium]